MDLVSSGEDCDPNSNSRHLSVNASQIYKDWNGPLLFDVRRRFQSLMFARDGYPLKTQATSNQANFKLVLRAAQAVMPTKEYSSFCAQMERAYQTKDKA